MTTKFASAALLLSGVVGGVCEAAVLDFEEFTAGTDLTSLTDIAIAGSDITYNRQWL